MKVLWLCNIILPKISKNISKPINNYGGWLTSLSDDVLTKDNVKLHIVFPLSQHAEEVGEVEGLKYISFNPKNGLEKYDKSLKNNFIKIIKQINPDIIHIFGTEFPHTFSMIEAAEFIGLEKRIIIHIQGLISIYEKHSYASLPQKVIKNYTVRDFFKKDNIKLRRIKYEQLGQYEIKSLSKVSYVTGRTTWDLACVKQINPSINYFHFNESLRDVFYENQWNFDNCEKYSIFTSQGSSPIKGFHYLLKALSIVVLQYPQVKLYVAGVNLYAINKLRLTYYQKYLLNLINTLGLSSNIVFVGVINETQMCEILLRSNIFVLPSSIENSPNSLGEAMILGVPSISSYVGGVPDMITHNKEGFLYSADAPYMLAYYINKVFSSDKNEITQLSEKARERALDTHNRANNLKNLLEIYKKIIYLDKNIL